MSSVDQRIVILTFDNKNFETNAKNSIDTLDKLKKGLDLEKSAKGLNAISESSKKFSLSGIGDAIESIKYRFSTLGVVGATVISELTKTAMSVGHKIISAIAGPLTAGGWRRALNIEQAQFQLEGLGVAWKDIEEDINYGVKDTAYGLDVAARAASQLVASGVQLGDEMKVALRGISGVASMTASSFEEISPIFTTVAGQGKLMTMQLRQLEMRGLNAAAVLGKTLNKTEAEVRDMVTKGEIDFATFAKAMDDAFGKHAKDANKTFTGALSNVKAALSRIGADVAATQLVNLRDIFNALIPLIDNIRKALGPLIEKFNQFSTKATAGTVKFINFLNSKTPQAKKNAQEVGDAMNEMAMRGINVAPKLAEAFEVTEEEFRDMVKGGRISLDKFSSVLEEKLGGDAVNILNSFKEKIKETEGDISNTAKTAGESIFGNIINVFKNIGSGIASVAKAIGSAFKEVFSGAFTSDAKRLSGNLKDLSENFKASEDGANGLKIVFKGLFTALKVVAKGLGWIGTGFIKFIEIIAKAIKKVVEFAGKLGKSFEESGRKAKFMEALGTVISKIGEILVAFKDKMVEVGKAIKNSEGFQKLAEALKLLGSVIKEFFAKIFDKFVEKMKAFGKLNPDFSWTDKLVSGLSFVMGKLADFIIAMINGEHPIRQFFGSISDTDKPLGKFVGFLGKIKDAIVNFFKGGGIGNVAEKGGSLLTVIKDFLVGGFEKLKEADIIGNIIEVFKGIAEKLKDVDWKYVKDTAFEIAKTILAFRYVNSLIKVNKKIASTGGLFGINLDLVQFANQLRKRDFSQKVKDLGIGLLALSGTLLILSKIPAEELKKSVIALGAVLAELLIVFGVVELLGKLSGGKGFVAFSGGMTLLGIGLLIIAGAIKIFSMMKPETIKKGGDAIFGFCLKMALASAIAGKGKFGTFVGMAIALMALVPAVAILGSMKYETINKAAEAILKVMMTLGLASRIAGRGKFGTFAGMAIALLILVPSVAILGKMDRSTVQKGAEAIFAVTMILALASRLAGQSSFGTLLGMALSVGAAAISLNVLSGINTDNLRAAVAGLSITLLAVAESVKIASGITKYGGIVALIAVIAAITAAFYLLRDVPYETTLGAALGIAIVAIALTSSLEIIEKSNITFKNTIGAVFTLSLLLYSIVGAFHLMKDIPIDTTLAITEGLSITALALSASLAIISKIDYNAAIEGIKAFDVFLLDLIVVMGVLGGIDEATGGTFGELISAGAGIFGKLGEGLGLFVGGIIGGIGQGITNSMPAIGTNLATFAENIKPFFEVMSTVNEGTLSSIDTLVQAVFLLSGTGLMDGLSRIFSFGQDPYEKVGQSLVTFAGYISEYSQKITNGGIDTAAVEASANAGRAIAEFAAAIPNEGGLLAGIMGENDLAAFAEKLVPFAEKLIEYSDLVTGKIDEDGVRASANAGKMIAEFAHSIPNEGGWLGAIMGENDLAAFSEKLVPFAEKIVEYSDIVRNGNIDEAAIKSSTNAGKMITEFANSIPNDGGFLGELVGNNDLADFTTKLVPFAEKIVEYSDIVKNGNIDEDAIRSSTNAGKMVTEFADTIPNDGGFLGEIVGNNDLEDFAKKLVPFAEAIVEYSNTISKGNFNESLVESSTNAGSMLAEMYGKVRVFVADGFVGLLEGNPLKKFATELESFGEPLYEYSKWVNKARIKPANIENSTNAAIMLTEFYSHVKNIVTGGLAGWFEGEPLKKFGQELANFAPYLVDYSNDIQNVQSDQISDVTSAVNDISVQVNSIHLLDYSNLKDFGDSLSYFGEKLKKYNTDVANFSNSKVQSVITTVYELIKVAESMAVVKTDAVNKFGDSLVNIGKKGINEFIRAFEDSTNRAYRAGENLVLSASNGASSGTSYYTWYNLGYYGGVGLINGLDSLYNYCWNAGYRIAEAAYQGAQTALDSHSPSRKFEQLGIFGDQGLINGLLKLAPKVYGVGEEVGDTILSAVANPLSKLKDLIDDKVDINPVITPVLDLSNVNSNVNRLSGMFSNQSMALNGTYGLRSVGNLNSIMDLAASMASSNVGANGDVVNAIYEMRNDILGLGDAISKMQVRLDGQALVGEIVEPMDYALGQRAEYAGRGI